MSLSKKSSYCEIGNDSTLSSGVITEERSFTWKIENFDVIRESDALISAQTFRFKAGNTIGLPTTWNCLLVPTKKNIGIFFVLQKKPKCIDEVNFAFCLKIKKPNGDNYFNQTSKLTNVLKTVSKSWGYSNVIKREDHVPLVCGSLILEVEFQLFTTKPVSLGVASKLRAFEMKAVWKLSNDLGKTDALANLVANSVTKIISKDNVEFAVNGGILSARSSVFQQIFQMNENQSGGIQLEDLSANTLRVLLHYICTGTLHKDWKRSDVIEELPYAAHKYQLNLLFKFLDDVLGSVCNMRNVKKLLILAKNLEMKKAKFELFTYLKNNAASSEDLP